MTKVLVKALRKAMLCLMVATMVVGFMPAVSLADEDETQSVGTAQEEQAAQEEAASSGASDSEASVVTQSSDEDGSLSLMATTGGILSFSQSNINSVGKQSSNSTACMCFAYAYAQTITTGSVHYWYEYNANGNRSESSAYAKGMSGSFESVTGGTVQNTLHWAYDMLQWGHPVIVWVNQKSGNQHWVTLVGFKNVTDENNLSLGNFLMLDPVANSSTSPEVLNCRGYTLRLGSNNLRYAKDSVNFIPVHAHSYSVSSYSYYNDINHTVNYNKCSCGATKSSEPGAHSFAWSGLTYKCSLCGTEYAPHGANSEYVTRMEVDIHSGDNAGTSVLGTIPGSTVVKVGETKTNSRDRYVGYVTYGGVSGWIHMSDVRYNGTAGIHSFKKGTCTVCGINQTGTKPGVYKTKHDSTLYYQNVWGSPRKTVAAGKEVAIVRIGITTEGYYWGYTSDGYCMSMTDLGYTRTGTVTGTPVTVPNGNYYIRLAKDTSFQMDIYYGSKDSGAKLTIYQVNNSGAQQFRLTKNSNGSYSIMNINSGMYLDAYSNGKTNGTAVWQYKSNGSEAQQWYIERNDDGTYSFRGVGSNLYMHIYDGKVTNSNAVHLWENRTSDNSHWYLAPMSASKKLTRLAGTDRYKTMAQIVKTEVAKTSTWAIVANGDKFPDALGSAALAGAYGAPIVTTKKGKLDASAKAQLKRLKAKYVLVLGDSKSISTKTLKQIKSLPSVKSVKRVSGKDRYATSLAVYKQFKSKTKSYSTLLIVDGATYVDALMSGAYAYAKKVPILLAKGGKLTSAAVKAVKADKKIKKIVVVSTGSKVNAKKIKSQLGSKYTYKTISGKSAYSTNASFINWSIRQGMTASKPVIATAKKYADAITGSVLAGKNNSVLVLADKATDASVKELAKYKLEMKNAYMLGDKNSVSVKNAKAIAKKLGLTYVTHSTDSAKKS